MPLEEVIHFNFTPSINGGHICSNDKRVLLPLLTRFGGLGIPLFHENARIALENSRKLTSSLTDLIKDQSVLYSANGSEQKKIKTTIKTERENIHKNVLNTLPNRLNENQLRLNSINREKGISSWLTSYPVSDHGFNKAAIFGQLKTKIWLGSTEYAVYVLLQCKDGCSACNELQKRRIRNNTT